MAAPQRGVKLLVGLKPGYISYNESNIVMCNGAVEVVPFLEKCYRTLRMSYI